jgi:hypothetical protein
VKEHIVWRYGNNAMDWRERFALWMRDPRKFGEFEIFPAEEGKVFCDMLRSILVLEPSQKATVEEIVRCECMQGCGLLEV